MKASQEPKYKAVGGKIVNRKSGEAIPDNEPVFILRAKDMRALTTLNYYMAACKDEGHRGAIQGRIREFEAFAEENPELIHEPDTEGATTPPETEEVEHIEPDKPTAPAEDAE